MATGVAFGDCVGDRGSLDLDRLGLRLRDLPRDSDRDTIRRSLVFDVDTPPPAPAVVDFSFFSEPEKRISTPIISVRCIAQQNDGISDKSIKMQRNGG
jgi:hypothetical protein